MRVSARHIALVALAALSACLSSKQSLFENPSDAATPRARTHAGGTGTAFFISDDGILLTAEHVVHQCLHIGLISEAVAPSRASVIAYDSSLDLALIRIDSQSPPPAALALAETPPRLSDAVKVYGYPHHDPRRSVLAEATVVNDKLPPRVPRTLTDPRFQVWIDGPTAPGFSGGPVIGSDGVVVGVLTGIAKEDSDLAPFSVARGIGLIARLTDNVEFKPPAAPIRIAPGDDGKAVRPAIVRVICWSATTPSLGEN
jgi:S1-C subfamily serine protease